MQLTVKNLCDLCFQELAKGNGNKKVVISDDNEGNGFHGLFYGFTQITEEEKEFYPFYDSQEEDISNLIFLG